MSGALEAIRNERERQNAKWGEQNHPDGTGEGHGLHARPFDMIRDAVRREVDRRAAAGESVWSWILLEEVFEALAEEAPERLRVELIQVAAVAVQWTEAIDRRSVRR